MNDQLALGLFNVGVIRFDGPFEFKIHENRPDFPLSPNKIDLRTPDNNGNLTPELVAAIGWEMWKRAAITQLRFDLVAGFPKAGEPFAEEVAKYAHKPLLKMEKKFYPAGQRRIAAVLGDNYQVGQRVLALDDVISQARTKLEGITAIESVALKVAALIVAVDREEGGSEYLESLGYRIYSVYAFSDLLKFYFRAGKISRHQMEESLAYSQEAKRLFLQTLG